MTGGMTGHVDTSNAMPATAIASPPVTVCARLVRRDAHAAARLAAAQCVDLAHGRPDLGAGSVGERGNAADVVDVGVRDEDAGGARAHARELEPQLGRVVAGVDDRRLGCAALASRTT